MLETLHKVSSISLRGGKDRIASLVRPVLFEVDLFSDGGQGPEKPVIEEPEAEEEVFTFPYPERYSDISDLFNVPVEGIAGEAHSAYGEYSKNSAMAITPQDIIPYIFASSRKNSSVSYAGSEFISLARQSSLTYSNPDLLAYSGYLASSQNFSYTSGTAYEMPALGSSVRYVQPNPAHVPWPLTPMSPIRSDVWKEEAYAEPLKQPETQTYSNVVQQPVEIEMPKSNDAGFNQTYTSGSDLKLDDRISHEPVQLGLPNITAELPTYNPNLSFVRDDRFALPRYHEDAWAFIAQPNRDNAREGKPVEYRQYAAAPTIDLFAWKSVDIPVIGHKLEFVLSNQTAYSNSVDMPIVRPLELNLDYKPIADRMLDAGVIALEHGYKEARTEADLTQLMQDAIPLVRNLFDTADYAPALELTSIFDGKGSSDYGRLRVDEMPKPRAKAHESVYWEEKAEIVLNDLIPNPIPAVNHVLGIGNHEPVFAFDSIPVKNESPEIDTGRDAAVTNLVLADLKTIDAHVNLGFNFISDNQVSYVPGVDSMPKYADLMFNLDAGRPLGENRPNPNVQLNNNVMRVPDQIQIGEQTYFDLHSVQLQPVKGVEPRLDEREYAPIWAFDAPFGVIFSKDLPYTGLTPETQTPQPIHSLVQITSIVPILDALLVEPLTTVKYDTGGNKSDDKPNGYVVPEATDLAPFIFRVNPGVDLNSTVSSSAYQAMIGFRLASSAPTWTTGTDNIIQFKEVHLESYTAQPHLRETGKEPQRNIDYHLTSSTSYTSNTVGNLPSGSPVYHTVIKNLDLSDQSGAQENIFRAYLPHFAETQTASFTMQGHSVRGPNLDTLVRNNYTDRAVPLQRVAPIAYNLDMPVSDATDEESSVQGADYESIVPGQDLEAAVEKEAELAEEKPLQEAQAEAKAGSKPEAKPYESNKAKEAVEASEESDSSVEALAAVGAVGLGLLAGATGLFEGLFKKSPAKETASGKSEYSLPKSEKKSSSKNCGDTSQCFSETMDWLEGKLENPTLSAKEHESISECYAEEIKNIQKAREYIKKREIGYSCSGALHSLFHHTGFTPEKERKYKLRDYIRDGKVQKGFKLATTTTVSEDVKGSYGIEARWEDDQKRGQSEKVMLKRSSAYAQLDMDIKKQGYTPVWKIMSYIDTETGQKRSGLYLETIAELHVEAKRLLGDKDKYGMKLMGVILLVNGEEPGNGTVSMHDYDVKPGDRIEAVVKNDSARYDYIKHSGLEEEILSPKSTTPGNTPRSDPKKIRNTGYTANQVAQQDPEKILEPILV
ncbi:MAG: hypothetical protein KKC75_00250 [Nanoarchaeota archaeon]|nr:hypothetical protein [Nanoarchaeota archaeon]MBU1004256.1 hypothetical protein [Nanoarchaeota archaeon]MBU1945417.1 hypothetical protein [Nanoarchaeota archaeon]